MWTYTHTHELYHHGGLGIKLRVKRFQNRSIVAPQTTGRRRIEQKELYHYGVKGMKWGVRRTPEQLGYGGKSNNNSNAPLNSGDDSDKLTLSNLPRIKGKHSISDDLTATNPNYGKGGAYKNNCGNCVVAFELRRRGYDVEASPNETGMSGKEVTANFKGFKFNETKTESEVLKWGEGARGVVMLKNENSRSGHMLSAVVQNGSVRFVDSQSGNDNARDQVSSAKIVAYVRVDNLEVTSAGMGAITKRSN